MNKWEIGWVCWGAFVIIWETAALIRKGKDDTLSYHLWKWFALRQTGNVGRFQKVRRLMLFLFFAYLIPHLLTGGALW